MQVKQAVILAAGMGTRLRPIGHQGPKGALTLSDGAIIQASVDRLQRAGIERVVIVTGYQSHFYQELAAVRPGLIETLHNTEFANSGSMYSLYLAREQVYEPFLLLESDLIYEQRALTILMEGREENLILLSGKTGAGDEVYVETDDDRKLIAMSKQREMLGEGIAGELVGVTKISPALFRAMCSYAEHQFKKKNLHLDYETDALVAAAASQPIHCTTVDDLLWAEIDDADHYQRAVEVDRLIKAGEADV